MERYISEIVRMLRELEDSDEIFVKQLLILIKEHFRRKRGR